MKKFSKNGFTIVEVALFLAISGAILAGIIIGTSNVINTQRYDDSMQNFSEFLRSVYTNVSSPIGSLNGRSEKSIYGKLISFGESYTNDNKNNDQQYIYTYNVIGNIDDKGIGGNTLASLAALNINVFISNNEGTKTIVGTPGEYALNWDAKIKDKNGNQFRGSILIVRSPSTGTIYTFYSQKVYEINEKIISENIGAATNPLSELINDFSNTDDIDFCVVPEGETLGHKPYNVKILRGSHSASGITYLPFDSEENQCQKM